MKQSDNILKVAFDSVRAEESLKTSTAAFVAEKLKKRRPTMPRWARMAAAAACMLLVFVAGYGTRTFFEPVSIISVDINPSLELGINTFDRVVSVDAYNTDGQLLAEELELRFLSSEEAVERIVTSQTITDLMEQEEFLSITVVGDDKTENERLCTRLEGYVSGTENAGCYHANSRTVAQAHSYGLSYGKYLAYLQAAEQDSTLTPEAVQSMTMKEIHAISGSGCGNGHHAAAGETTPDTEETTAPTQESHGHGKKKHKGKHH